MSFSCIIQTKCTLCQDLLLFLFLFYTIIPRILGVFSKVSPKALGNTQSMTVVCFGASTLKNPSQSSSGAGKSLLTRYHSFRADKIFVGCWESPFTRYLFLGSDKIRRGLGVPLRSQKNFKSVYTPSKLNYEFKYIL